MLEPERYSIMVRFVTVEGEALYRATVRELPDVAEYAKTANDAYNLVVDAIRDLSSAAEEDGVAFPEPIAESSDFSGRITLRMPPSLHAKVNLFSDLDATSLNQYIVAVLAATVGAASRPADVWGATERWVSSRTSMIRDYPESVTAVSEGSHVLSTLLSDVIFSSAESYVKQVAKRAKVTSRSTSIDVPTTLQADVPWTALLSRN